VIVTALALAATTLVAPNPAQSATPLGSKPLRDAVTVDGITKHLQKFQEIGTKYGNRQAGTPGFDASADYVAKTLKNAGYKVRVQPFDFLSFKEIAAPTLSSAGGAAYDATTLLYSGSGAVEGAVVVVAGGCASSDFPLAGSAPQIALVTEAACGLDSQVSNAVTAGYDAVIVAADAGLVPTQVTGGHLTAPATVPVVGVTREAADALRAGGATVRLETRTATDLRSAANVIGTSKFGNRNKTLVVGGHLDSVSAGPGINDNGSGSATILEIARQIDKLHITTKNRLRFAFWGAEEFGLIGSRYYVNSLSEKQRDRVLANLNFDMVGSTNYVRFVYDGDGSTGGPVGPPGSDAIEKTFVKYFKSQGLASDPTPFNGRSDYGPFIAVGIPAGGLFSGAEGVKTEEQEEKYGGTAGVRYDTCYHQSCDTIDNV
jgi:Zn-dependent M28 family amino/carboxypeptidase